MPILILLRFVDRGRMEKLLQRLPLPLIEYPFEVVVSVWGLFSGPALALGFVRPESLTRLLPDWIVVAYGLAMTTAALTIALGLRARRYGTTVPRGLELLGTACICYAIAILWNVGWRGGVPVGPLLTAVACLCWLRALYLAVLHRILRRVAKEAT